MNKGPINISLGSELNSNAFSKSLNSNRLTKISETRQAKKLQPTKSLTSWCLNSQKSGEILRSKSGQFSFVCMFCEAVFFNCQKIVEHINTHFVNDNDVEMSDVAEPEFVSLGVIKSEVKTEPMITPTAIVQQNPNPNVSSQPIPMNLLLNNIKTEKPDDDDVDHQVDKSTPSPKTSTVEIVKLKPVKLRPHLWNGSVRKRVVDVDGGSNKDNRKILSSNPSPNVSVVKIVNMKPKPVQLISLQKMQTEHVETLLNQKKCIAKPQAIATIKKPSDEAKRVCLREPAAKSSTKPQVIATIKKQSDKVSLMQSKDTKRERLQEPASKLSAKPQVIATMKKLSEEEEQVSAAESTANLNKDEIQLKKVFYAQEINRYRCYQCEMEPRIHNPSDNRRHFCHLCTEQMPNHSEFEKHIQNVHKEDINKVYCNGYYCYVCEKKFSTRMSLLTHFGLMHQNTDHLCAVCGSIFRSFSRLKSHMKNSHENRSYKCDICGREFKRLDVMRTHMGCHNTELNFVCKICSKGFKMQRYLNRHMAVHNDAKINCRHCDATFNFVSVRRAHEISRHNVV